MKNMSDCVYPCPCGYCQSTTKPCTCATATVTKYQKRISGPLLDRIDIHIEVPSVDYEKLSGDRLGETSESIRKRVQVARNIQQQQRFASSQSGIICNADIRVGEIRQFCMLQDDGQSLMRAATSCCAWHNLIYLQEPIVDKLTYYSDLAGGLKQNDLASHDQSGRHEGSRKICAVSHW
mgnify:CR=1 FL=1